MIRNILATAGVFALLLAACSKKKDAGTVVENLPNTAVLSWNEVACYAFDRPAYCCMFRCFELKSPKMMKA